MLLLSHLNTALVVLMVAVVVACVLECLHDGSKVTSTCIHDVRLSLIRSVCHMLFHCLHGVCTSRHVCIHDIALMSFGLCT